MGRPICRHCYHPQEVHDVNGRGECACGCVKLVPLDREAHQRTWLVDVEFFVRNRWIAAPQQRVRAQAYSGAAFKGVRAAKAAVLRPRQRVQQVRMMLTPVPSSRG